MAEDVGVRADSTGGSQLAEPLWSSQGIGVLGLVSAAMIALGVLLCWRLVQENEAEQEA